MRHGSQKTVILLGKKYHDARKMHNHTKNRHDYEQLQHASKQYKNLEKKAIQRHRVKTSNDLKQARFKSFNNANSKPPFEANPDEIFELFKENCNSEHGNVNVNFDSDSLGYDLCDSILNVEFTEEEAYKVLNKLNNGKASVNDLIINEQAYCKVELILLLGH